MEVIKSLSQRAEFFVNEKASPIRPYLSHIGRFLLVATFFEDALRICVQYAEQVDYMRNYRNMPMVMCHLFLFYCVGAMVGGSSLALARKQMFWACGLLTSVVLVQSIGYGILFHLSFLTRNLSLIGGILLLLAESMEFERKRTGQAEASSLFRGLPTISASESEKTTYISLIGRVLLIFLFGSLMYSTSNAAASGWQLVLRGLYWTCGSVACLMVAVGFKARYSAMLLVAILCVANIFMNPWWKHGHGSAERDFLRYDFFQTLSIIGGFMLLLNSGPGGMSFDKRRKEF
jgi:hypothetical protein